MMQYLVNVVWAAVQTVFAYLFFSCFLERKGAKEEAGWLLTACWIALSVYSFFVTEGLYGYLMYLLTAVIILLCLFGEAGTRGLCLLGLAVLIPACCDALPGGKMLPIILVVLLRHFRRYTRRAPQSEMENLLLRQHMEMQRESMAALEQNYRQQRKNTHEFEHHMQVLRDLLEQGQADAAAGYLDRLKKNRSICAMNVNSRHPVIDVILNQKYQMALENEIKMQIQVNDLSALRIPADALVVVLTNLLDNAIEACRRLDGYREIFCSILYEEGLYISIRNTSEAVTVADGKIPTSKQDSLSHGFGLMSVIYVLDTLQGEYTFGYDEGWFQFAAEIA